MTSASLTQELLTSQLYDEKTFYQAFINDLTLCKREVIIESPFITTERMKGLRSLFSMLVDKGIKVNIFTRAPSEHIEEYLIQSEEEIRFFEEIGVQVYLCVGNHHRKLAILDRKIIWEGSLNILSQTNSREIMRRIEGEQSAKQMFDFLKLEKFI